VMPNSSAPRGILREVEGEDVEVSMNHPTAEQPIDILSIHIGR